MRLVPTTRSWNGTTGNWMRSRALVLTRAFVLRGLDVRRAFVAATALLAHLWIETGGGRVEQDNNVGNIKVPRNWESLAGVAAMRTNVHDGTQPYRAYRSIEEGIEAYVRLLESANYGRALAALFANEDGRAWYEAIMRAGYHPFSEGGLALWEQIHRRMLGA